jgi:hypothetical protein
MPCQCHVKLQVSQACGRDDRGPPAGLAGRRRAARRSDMVTVNPGILSLARMILEQPGGRAGGGGVGHGAARVGEVAAQCAVLVAPVRVERAPGQIMVKSW